MPKAQLVELYAHKLGVIDDAHLEFGPGFNVLTGETGAGKTLLLGALGLCLGGDASASRYALTNDTRAVALFVRGAHEELAFARESGSSGRLRSSLNGAPSSAEALRVVAEDLIIIHGQHDSLLLKNRSEIVRLIDESGGVDTVELSETRRRLREARQLRDEYGGDHEARQRDLEYLEFQLNELDAAQITSSTELAETLSELTRLTSLREGQSAIAEVMELFDGDHDDAVLSLFARALGRLPDGDAYGAVREALNNVLVGARDSLHELATLADPDAFDPRVLEELEARASVLQHVSKKYGGSLEAALVRRDELRRRRRDAEGDAERVGAIDQEIQELERVEVSLARQAKLEREAAAAKLTSAITRQMPRVALTNATVRFVVDGDDGSDAQIFFAPNPGQPEGPLSALASGGELSRVLLALSLETVHRDVVAVFDEIDAGLGGQVAQQIGECLREVGQQQQVLAITHLASVAARADHHFVIEKSVEEGTTSTVVREVRGDDRVREIARMLAGDTLTRESRALATQLLENTFEDRAGADLSR
ncbi:MAG: AAA family ATPase [Acidimicrobiales bacterium]|jgi:DNA repair protein RecN (Recombination protein N)